MYAEYKNLPVQGVGELYTEYRDVHRVQKCISIQACYELHAYDTESPQPGDDLYDTESLQPYPYASCYCLYTL